MGKAIINKITKALKGQRGFTLIELLAVLSIVSILAGIVTTGVTGQTGKGEKASAQQDLNSTNTSAQQYFSDRIVGIFTTSTVSLTVTVSGATVSNATQETVSRWPEAFITEELDAGAEPTTRYTNEFPSANSPTSSVIDNIILKDLDGDAIDGASFLTTYTAVNFDRIIADGYSDREPASVDETTSIEGTDFHAFLWLFRKSSTAGESGTDSRIASLFQLTNVEVDSGASKPVSLTYTQIN